MQKWILWILFSLCTLNNANAADCNVYQDKIHKLENLRRHGGNLKQMERWRMQAEEVTSKRNRCNNQRSSIQIASGRTTPPHSRTKANKSSDNTGSYSASTTTQALHNSNNQQPNISIIADLPIVRTLKDCIKPNNLIDNDVQECRQGLRDPIWKH